MLTLGVILYIISYTILLLFFCSLPLFSSFPIYHLLFYSSLLPSIFCSILLLPFPIYLPFFLTSSLPIFPSPLLFLSSFTILCSSILSFILYVSVLTYTYLCSTSSQHFDPACFIGWECRVVQFYKYVFVFVF